MKLTAEKLRRLIHSIQTTKQVEIDCDECFERLHKFAELKLRGKNSDEALPLVRDHLKRCNSCHQEYEALLTALKHIRMVS